MQTFDVYLVIDADGNHAAGTTEDGAKEAYTSEIADLGDIAYRIVKVPVVASLPRIVDLAAVTAPDEE